VKIGAHMSTAGGLHHSLDRAQAIGAEALQIFCSPPQSWAFKPLAEDEVISFLEKSEDTCIGPCFLHGIYLVNLGSPNNDNQERSMTALINYMQCANQIGAQGVIFHSGSHKGAGFDAVFPQTVDRLKRVLDESPAKTQLIIENCAGMGNQIGSTFNEIGRLITALDDARVKVCLDTQHSFAAGYDLSTEETLIECLSEFESEIGLDQLVVVHANDSKRPFKSGVDRHENIGEGPIGLDGFRVIMAHPSFQEIPFVLEVPGFDGKGPDKENVDRLKEIRSSVATG